MFDAVAAHYDRMNKFMSLGMDQGWRRFLIEGLEVRFVTLNDRLTD